MRKKKGNNHCTDWANYNTGEKSKRVSKIKSTLEGKI